MRSFIKKTLPIVDITAVPFVYIAAFLLKTIRKVGVQRLPYCKDALLKVGVFPIRDHYYEPQFNFKNIKHAFSDNRNLPGIDWNVAEQLKLLSELVFAEELSKTPTKNTKELHFSFGNDAFESGDAEYWYQIIRAKKPKRIIEVGSGHSTLMAIQAIAKNKIDDTSYTCIHTCIEPYEQPWLEKTGVTVIRSRVEDLDPSFFSSLQENDILFIDSSHIIRPQGDVLFEYLEVLPSLNKGVIVHIHDIFSPKDYLTRWLQNDMRFWNEQYLLEAFLTHNNEWKIIGALNFLHHNYYDELKDVAPFLVPSREPGSFYIQRTS